MSHNPNGKRPISPPHSNNGDFGIESNINDFSGLPYTPPTPYTHIASSNPHHQMYPEFPEPHSYYESTPPASTGYKQHFPVHQHHQPIGDHYSRIVTRSGKPIGPPLQSDDRMQSQSPRSTPSRRTKARTSRARKELQSFTLPDCPLSELFRSKGLVPKDMEEVVHRSNEVRQQEVVDKGKIARPMNSFMLYRAAYQDNAQKVLGMNNHQTVSQIAGTSWRLEPKEIKDLYTRLASIEKDNHAAAFPAYKFAPNKKRAKRSRVNGDDDDDGDSDYQGPKKTRPYQASWRESSRSTASTPFADRTPSPHTISYHTVAPYGYSQTSQYGRPLYAQMAGRVDPSHHYPEYVTHSQYHPSHMVPVSYDEQLPMQPYEDLPLVSLPGGDAAAYQHQPDFSGFSAIDPGLDQAQASHSYMFHDESSYMSHVPMDGHGVPVTTSVATATTPHSHPGLATLTSVPDDEWAEDTGAQFDAEFRKLEYSD